MIKKFIEAARKVKTRKDLENEIASKSKIIVAKNYEITNLEKEVEKLQQEKYQMENAITDCNSHIEKLESKLKESNLKLKKFYLISHIDTVRAFAAAAVDNDALDLFDPMSYIKDQNYAQTIELHADELLELIKYQRNEHDFYDKSGVEKAREKIKEIFKKAKPSKNSVTSFPGIKSLSKLEHLDDER